MPSLPHERLRDGVIPLVPASGSRYADGSPLPTNWWMALISNATHLAIESKRHLVSDDFQMLFELGDKTNTWEGLIDATAPSDAELAAIPADQRYRSVSWAPEWTRKYGPLPAIADRQTTDGRTVLRRIKGRVSVSGNTLSPSFDSLVVIALTTHGDPARVNAGDVLALDSQLFTVAGGAIGATDIDFDFAPDVPDRGTEAIYCRRAGTLGGPVQTLVTPLYLWVCVSSQDGVFVSRVDAWEAP